MRRHHHDVCRCLVQGTGALEYDDTYAEVWLDGRPVERKQLIDSMFKSALNPPTSPSALDTMYEVPHD